MKLTITKNIQKKSALNIFFRNRVWEFFFFFKPQLICYTNKNVEKKMKIMFLGLYSLLLNQLIIVG